MLTAHALSVESTIKSFRGGAASYVPKDEMAKIETFLTDILEARNKGKAAGGAGWIVLALIMRGSSAASGKRTTRTFGASSRRGKTELSAKATDQGTERQRHKAETQSTNSLCLPGLCAFVLSSSVLSWGSNMAAAKLLLAQQPLDVFVLRSPFSRRISPNLLSIM